MHLHTRSHPCTWALSLSHTHTHTRTRTRILTLLPSATSFYHLCLPLLNSFYILHCSVHSHTCILLLSLSLSLTHTHTHTPMHLCVCACALVWNGSGWSQCLSRARLGLFSPDSRQSVCLLKFSKSLPRWRKILENESSDKNCWFFRRFTRKSSSQVLRVIL